jgi:hypothetical protein
VRAGRLRQVARLALLGRHGEDLTAGLEGGAHAGGRQHGAAHHAHDLLRLRSRPWKVSRHLNRQPARLLRRQVEQMQIAALLVDDGVARGGRVHHVEVGVAGERRDVPGPGAMTV